jgi:hypothetical protein
MDEASFNACSAEVRGKGIDIIDITMNTASHRNVVVLENQIEVHGRRGGTIGARCIALTLAIQATPDIAGALAVITVAEPQKGEPLNRVDEGGTLNAL